jgi:hypothetical protein
MLRDLDGLLSTLTPDCGARRFYTELLTAFPEIRSSY